MNQMRAKLLVSCTIRHASFAHPAVSSGKHFASSRRQSVRYFLLVFVTLFVYFLVTLFENG